MTEGARKRFVRAARAVLLGFVLISIGYAIGKEVTSRRPERPSASPSGTLPAASGRRVIVTYMHGTLRCVTCNSIEKMARELVQNEFAREAAAGRVAWKTVNFQEDPALAGRYKVASSTLVVVHVRDGKEIGFKRLDDVWVLYTKPGEFAAYVGGAVRACLAEETP
jgi:hypothetical protein